MFLSLHASSLVGPDQRLYWYVSQLPYLPIVYSTGPRPILIMACLFVVLSSLQILHMQFRGVTIRWGIGSDKHSFCAGSMISPLPKSVIVIILRVQRQEEAVWLIGGGMLGGASWTKDLLNVYWGIYCCQQCYCWPPGYLLLFILRQALCVLARTYKDSGIWERWCGGGWISTPLIGYYQISTPLIGQVADTIEHQK